MVDQYFSNNPAVKSDPKSWAYDLRGHTFTFMTDNGVFSKHEVDFGSKVLIEQFRIPGIEGPLLDLGCGYGPIAIALGFAYPEHTVIGVDVNRRALMLAEQNAEHNHIDNVSFKESDMLEGLAGQSFAAIITNPPIRAGKAVVHQMFEQAETALLSGGELWVVIQKKQGAPSAQKKLSDLFDTVELIKKTKGYFIIRARK
ncbi:MULTISPECIES: class I SAM-dependent methyltransferase [Gracilibacillus]|uniref:class I SAM-dependent methyltransferase n=1 Tax=Gracilibacillus TaxID=74385 RepID=UPI0008246DDC|nr:MULTISPECIES: class I SAM-dependent methyltransferase [Gracilibacillus]